MKAGVEDGYLSEILLAFFSWHWSRRLTSHGSGDQDPSILSGTMPEMEPWIHELGAGLKRGAATS